MIQIRKSIGLATLYMCVATASAQIASAPGERDGQVRLLQGGDFIAWDAEQEQWLETEAFWAAFAARGRGKAWPSDSRFPAYGDVNEHDTFLYQTDHGPCLMYFFHTRWRRANDVWRWGPEFNDYGGCANVFD